jgi:hypothetical protein
MVTNGKSKQTEMTKRRTKIQRKLANGETALREASGTFHPRHKREGKNKSNRCRPLGRRTPACPGHAVKPATQRARGKLAVGRALGAANLPVKG